jgi:cytochrome c
MYRARAAATASTIVLLLATLLACKKTSGDAPETRSSGSATTPTTSAAATPETKAARGTPAEAKAMLAKAVDHYRAVGRTQAFADFNTRKAPFFDRDLYVACAGPDRRITANGGYPNLVGSPLDAMKDADGKPLGKAFWDAATESGGSVKYRWLNPVSNKVEPKISFVQRVGSDTCAVGAYNPE